MKRRVLLVATVAIVAMSGCTTPLTSYDAECVTGCESIEEISVDKYDETVTVQFTEPKTGRLIVGVWEDENSTELVSTNDPPFESQQTVTVDGITLETGDNDVEVLFYEGDKYLEEHPFENYFINES